MSISYRPKLFLLSGMATAPNFMETFGEQLCRTLEGKGFRPAYRLLFPYGDWSRKAAVQMLEIYRDLRLGPQAAARSIGGRRAAEAIRSFCGDGLPVLIGHSGGGVAGVQAAELLRPVLSAPGILTIQIGSPKCPVSSAGRDRALYIRGIGAKGGDPIARLGSWGGWVAGASGLRRRFRYDRFKHAPAYRLNLALTGGHPDYFRGHEPFVNPDGRTNLQTVADYTTAWLLERWESEDGA